MDPVDSEIAKRREDIELVYNDDSNNRGFQDGYSDQIPTNYDDEEKTIISAARMPAQKYLSRKKKLNQQHQVRHRPFAFAGTTTYAVDIMREAVNFERETLKGIVVRKNTRSMPRILPVEIIETEVLPRLLAKSVCRFRCVCKAWNSFLSTPDFVRTHLTRHTNIKLLLLGSDTFRTFDCEQPLNNPITTCQQRPIPFKDVLILGSLDGLLCVALKKTQELAFWNPLTRAYKQIRTSFFDHVRNGAFAFYTDSSNDYKLVHIIISKHRGSPFIYSRRLDSWRKVNNISSEISRRMSKDFTWSLATFSCGKVYFKLESKSKITGQRPCCLISFDVESEQFKEIQLPPLLHPGARWVLASVVALNGCIHLCVAYVDITPEDWKCGMWRLDGDDDHVEWMKVVTFPILHYNPFRNIYTKKNGNWLAIWKDGNSTIKNIGLEEFATDFDCYFFRDSYRGAIYTETLVSPNP